MTHKKSAEKQPPSTLKKPSSSAGFWQVFWYKISFWTVKHKFWQKLTLGLIALVLFTTGSMYAVAQWYIDQNKNIPLQTGATFIPDYARYFGLDPKETMRATLEDLGIKRIRLVSYWENHEPEPGVYNFDELDWQFDMAESYGAKVSLSIGLRQPRWPECHKPDWAAKLVGNEWRQPLYDYMTIVVNRYKDRPSLDSYQLENEYFLSVFGICDDFDRDRLVYEYELVKKLDPNTTLIVSRSNNAVPSWPVGSPRADQVGAAIYKRVWDKTITRRYFEYPVPAWYYAFLAGMTKITTGRETFIHELQTEAWTPDSFGGTRESPISEQYKSMNATMLKDRIAYGKATGMRAIDMWGVEWWYWLKTVKNEPAIWDTAKSELQKINQENQNLNQ